MNRTFISIACGSLLVLALATGCTGGQETSASSLEADAAAQEPTGEEIDARKKLATLSPAIPLYTGAEYREDFTRRDAVMVRNEYGADAEVLTLASDDALPKIWHYYVTYLAQYRAWDPVSPYPPEKKTWRTLEVNLTSAMQDPFVPDTNLKLTDREVILQVAETQAEPPTIIRYIIRPRQIQQTPEAIASAAGAAPDAATTPAALK